MSYWKNFHKDRVVEALSGPDIESAFDQMTKALVSSKTVSAAVGKKIRASLEEKLEQGATGAIGHGVAVPHVKLPEIKETAAAFGRAPEGIDFRAGDGQDVTIVFFVIGPVDAPAEHLEFLRWIAGLARDPDFPRFALSCGSKAEILDLLKEKS